MTKVLFVCMGNICRSPTAEGVFRHQVEAAGLADRIQADSAGTHDYHIGEPPDRRSQAMAAKRGYDLSGLRGRQVRVEDFHEFDYVLAMDRHNLSILQQLCPPEHARKLRLFLEFSSNFDADEVPDPYYGGAQGFEHVLDLVEDAARGLLEEIRSAELDGCYEADGRGV
ncbi:MAG: low molecular weight protein-tyrosine-phosphatase [Pseudomonadota bacterium]